jgi:hypothetical protein
LIWNKLGGAGDKLRFISAHFFHNLLTTTLILPTSLIHDDIEHIANPVDSFWADNWDGRIALPPAIFLSFDLGLIALGIATAWKKWKWGGVLPGLVFLVYCFGLGLARTSGGRYIVPIDWILYLYFGGGMVTIIQWGDGIFGKQPPAGDQEYAANPPAALSRRQVINNGIVLILFLSAGLILPGTEKIFPVQVFPKPARELVNVELKNGGYDDSRIAESKLIILSGRAINPRYFFYRQDIIPGGAVGFPMRYPRFVFTLIGKGTPMVNVVLPTKLIPENIPNGTIVSVAGCWNKHEFMDAVLVSYNNQIYYRYPAAENLKCPMQELVCNDNDRTCK